ncbi:hypothetical protein [Mycobacterium lentiflavum]|uniref:hypothetical protein n=1 Tax=Mycobacterium lentiflavum TaxID=141349 RepID=UPI000B818E93|nr:hypothetical protein [Mycobacterium lentiflavum]
MKPEWAAVQTAEGVGDLLKTKYPHLEIVGFDHNSDIRSVREFAEAIDDMLNAYPEVVLTKVSITKPPPGMKGAWAWATPSPTSGGNMSASIDLNADMAADWPGCCQAMQNEVVNNWAFGDPSRPVYSAIVHEFGHAVDFAALKSLREKEAMHEETKRVLLDLWYNTAADVQYGTWLRGQMSKYSFLDPNEEYSDVDAEEVHPFEVLAEAFTDVELNGDNARETSKALHKLMKDSLP